MLKPSGFRIVQSSSTTVIPPQIETHTPPSPQITVTSSSQHLCQQHAETLLKQARYTCCFGITKSLKGIYSEAQPAAAQMAPRGPGATAAPPPGAAAAHQDWQEFLIKACDDGSDGPCCDNIPVSTSCSLLLHGEDKCRMVVGDVLVQHLTSVTRQHTGNSKKQKHADE